MQPAPVPTVEQQAMVQPQVVVEQQAVPQMAPGQSGQSSGAGPVQPAPVPTVDQQAVLQLLAGQPGVASSSVSTAAVPPAPQPEQPLAQAALGAAGQLVAASPASGAGALQPAQVPTAEQQMVLQPASGQPVQSGGTGVVLPAPAPILEQQALQSLPGQALQHGGSSSSAFATALQPAPQTVPQDGQPDTPVKVRTEVRAEGGRTGTTVTLDVASPNVIVSVYLLMYVPIAMGWMALWKFGNQEAHYMIMLPITLCTLIVGLDLINQSLSIVMDSPMAITAIQGVALAGITGVWTLITECRRPSVVGTMMWPLLTWGIVALMFTLFQLINHQVSYWCSLSERTVFTNLCPVASMFVEMTLMSKNMKVTVTFWSKMALSTMVLGALLYSIQYPDFTPSGVLFACLMVAVIIPYRLLQRFLLAKCANLPLPLLAFSDGVFLIVPSSIISATQQDHFWSAWSSWFSHPSICLMLLFSLIIFTGNHMVGLMMLRIGSATNYLVFHNLANFLVVTMGILFFGDDISSSPLELLGLIISLLGGLWYAVEVQRKHHYRSERAQRPLQGDNEDEEEEDQNEKLEHEPWEGRSEDEVGEKLKDREIMVTGDLREDRRY